MNILLGSFESKKIKSGKRLINVDTISLFWLFF
jgi:hypothetical protein